MSGAKYKTFQQIASGGMADLYIGVIGFESGFKKICAIKKLRAEHAGKPVFDVLMRTEARLGEMLMHPNVVQVQGFDVVEGSNAIILEYIQGVDLERMLARTVKAGMAVSLPMALLIVSDIARALDYVHTCRDVSTGEPTTIIHADISPSNILVSFQAEVKLGDFGIACARLSGTHDATSGIRGKYAYMPPEQAAALELSPAADIFALGCVFWELVTGEKLFEHPNPPAHFAKLEPQILTEALRTRCPDDPALEAILLRCLAVAPSARYASAIDLERDVLDLIQARYDTFTRQRLGTFVSTLFSKERAELEKLIQGAVNVSVVDEFTGADAASAPPSPAPQSFPPPTAAPQADAQPRGVGPPALASPGLRIHRGIDLSLVGAMPAKSVESLPVPLPKEPVAAPLRLSPSQQQQRLEASRPAESLTQQRLRLGKGRRSGFHVGWQGIAAMAGAVVIILAGTWFLLAPSSHAARKKTTHSAPAPRRSKPPRPAPSTGGKLPEERAPDE